MMHDTDKEEEEEKEENDDDDDEEEDDLTDGKLFGRLALAKWLHESFADHHRDIAPRVPLTVFSYSEIVE